VQLVKIILILTIVSLVAADANAGKWDLEAFGGYRWGGDLSDGSYADDPDNPVNVSDLHFTSGPSWGFSAGYNINPRFEIKLKFDRQHTTFQFTNDRLGADETLGDTKLDYLMAGLAITLVDEDFKLKPYFAFYLGATHLTPDDSSRDSSWYSALGYALGVRYFFTEYFGVMVENTGESTILTDGATLFCTDDGQCVTIPKDTWMWQIGLSAGVVFTF